MIDKNRCPLCGLSYDSDKKEKCTQRLVERGTLLICKYYNINCVVDASVGETHLNEDSDEAYRRFNSIVSFLLQKPYASEEFPVRWRFFYEKRTIGKHIQNGVESDGPVSFNIANVMVDYPRSFHNQINSVLLSLSVKYPKMGMKIKINGFDRALYYVTNVNPDENVEEIRGILDRLVELGYLIRDIQSNYEISANGWIYIGELSRIKNEINQGFIAMQFSEDTIEIGEAFRSAISQCGYTSCRIDQKEHNNQIVPEIFYEIKRSKFLVVDVTFPNYGAYYEAGYAEALNKQVIVCCKKDIFESTNKPHFDIAQKSTVVWTDLDDLNLKLKSRIEATVGLISSVFR